MKKQIWLEDQERELIRRVLAYCADEGKREITDVLCLKNCGIRYFRSHVIDLSDRFEKLEYPQVKVSGTPIEAPKGKVSPK